MKEMKIKLPTFSVVEDEEEEEGVYLHFGQVQILVAHDSIELAEFIIQLRKIDKEIQENYKI